MAVLFEKMGMLVILLILGYLCAKIKLVGPEFNKGLSKLIMNFFIVGMILSSVVNKEISLTPQETAYGFLMMVIMYVICFAIAFLSPRLFKKSGGDLAMYTLLIAFTNNGFIGFPVVSAVLGDGALFFASLSNIPFNLLLYSLGVIMLQNGEKSELKLRQFLSTPLIATLVAAVIFVFRIPIPAVIDDTLDSISAATVPLSMICIGLSLSSVSIGEVFTKPRLYVINFIRLIVCPLAVWFVLHFFITDPIMLGTIIIVSACPSAVVCTILGIQYGRDGVESSESIFLSTVLSMLTMPLLISVLGLG